MDRLVVPGHVVTAPDGTFWLQVMHVFPNEYPMEMALVPVERSPAPVQSAISAFQPLQAPPQPGIYYYPPMSDPGMELTQFINVPPMFVAPGQVGPPIYQGTGFPGVGYYQMPQPTVAPQYNHLGPEMTPNYYSDYNNNNGESLPIVEFSVTPPTIVEEADEALPPAAVDPGASRQGQQRHRHARQSRPRWSSFRKFCEFCKTNRETRAFFESHSLKEETGKVTCPVLRSYVCPLCKATGDDAHTLAHCPENKGERRVESFTEIKKMFAKNAAGKHRRRC